MTTVDNLSNIVDFDLRAKFPRPTRAIIRRCFWWFVIYIGMALVFFLAFDQVERPIHFRQALEWLYEVSAYIIIGASIIMVGKVIYEIISHQMNYYGIERGHLVVSHGILLRERGLYPISRVTDVYLDRDAIDFLFGLYNLYTSNPSGPSHKYSDIYGLSKRSAVAMQDYLVKLADVTEPNAVRATNRFPPENEQGVMEA